MAQTIPLVDALKTVLRARAMTYARLAKALGVSEATVKRTFAARSFTLERLDEICDVLGIQISDLAKMVAEEATSPERLTLEQEQRLIGDPKLLLVAVHAINQWSLEDIVETYTLSKPECIRLLARLDKLGIIELLPNNRIRVRVARNFEWLPDGPIQQYFRAQVQNDFFKTGFEQSGEKLSFVSGMLSRASNAAIQNRMRRLTSEFAEMHQDDLALPLSERFGTSLLVAVRPWIPEAFKRLRRKPALREF